MDDTFWNNLPSELDIPTYRSLHSDLAQFSAEELEAHYERFGRNEGRIGNTIQDRNAFAALIPSNASALEIGPFCFPIMHGDNVAYLDLAPRSDLIQRAKKFGLDPARTPEIDYVSPKGDLSVIDRKFDFVISSHSIEHQPDLAHHLSQVHSTLRPGGGYFTLIPDKRYCFDHFIPESSIVDVIIAHRERRESHPLHSLVSHRALITHNDANRHWQNDHGIQFVDLKHRVELAIQEFEAAPNAYIDVHAWFFTPQNCSSIMTGMRDLGLSKFKVHRVYPTRCGAGEFWMILRAD